ncbi:helix-turn-helix domain-containing protein [Bacillus sp. Marseille-P3661]|uniref:helix-turn-helix domain-containing protein n=1 Tax=Bacillus sp. Marseille-P3661 TaxID=1936234 RepID=UPI000C8241F1|nr:helix-turn-helix domain-containing protein [Bacillus sp. Marseille-P3661]
MAEILIVDSDRESRQHIRSIIESSHYSFLSIHESNNAHRGEMLLKQSKPTALILDASLPDKDGFEFGKLAKQMYPDLSIIMVSQLKMFEMVYDAINAGFSSYLLKPLSKDELLSAFDRVINPSIVKEMSRTMQKTSEEFVTDLKKPIESAIRFIQLNYGDQLTLKDMADLVYLSPSYFSKLFKEETGTTFVEYLSWIRVQKAKSMLRMSSIPIDVIANNTGFKNSSYFSTIFKRVEGKTPSQYRDQFYWKQKKQQIV